MSRRYYNSLFAPARFNLTVTKSDDHCMQSWEVESLTAEQVRAEQRSMRQLYGYPGSPFNIHFDVEAA